MPKKKYKKKTVKDILRGDTVAGAVASWLVRSSPDRAVRGYCVVFLGKNTTQCGGGGG